jgi:hypothetical protein
MKVRKYRALPVQDQLIYFEALVWLVFYRITFKIRPFKKLSASLGQFMAESPPEVQEEQRKQAQQVAKAVNTLSTGSTWRNQCLVCALAAKTMLKRRGINSTLYMGAALDQNQQMIAHAWLRCGDLFLVGGDERHNFAVTGKFADVQ